MRTSTSERSSNLEFEQALWKEGYQRVAGVDEAGRGCLAGPVVAAAVIWPEDLVLDGIDDSKRLKPPQREAAFEQIYAHALSIGVGFCSPAEIDDLNILWAAMEAMRRAVVTLDPGPDFLLIDGNRCFPNCEWPYRTIIKGDQRSQAIAAASIVAKVTRDRFMELLHEEYPQYGWNRHKGYPTPAHYAALAEHGPSAYHRHSFRLSR